MLGHLLPPLNAGSPETAWTGGICLPLYAKQRIKKVLPQDKLPVFICVSVCEGRRRGRRMQSAWKAFPRSAANLHQGMSSGLSPH